MEVILLETGGTLLLEPGGYFLLEAAPVPEPPVEGRIGMLEDLYGPDWLNAEAHGARGDGFTDSTAAIQAALSTGKNVYLPVGDYVIREALTVSGGQSLIGPGSQLASIRQEVPAAGGVTVEASTGTVIHGITFDGFEVAVTLSGGTGNTVSGCAFTATSGTSISLAGGEAACTVTGAVEASPAGATAFIKTASGTSCIVVNDVHVTANSFATGTAYEILATGGTAH